MGFRLDWRQYLSATIAPNKGERGGLSWLEAGFICSDWYEQREGFLRGFKAFFFGTVSSLRRGSSIRLEFFSSEAFCPCREGFLLGRRNFLGRYCPEQSSRLSTRSGGLSSAKIVSREVGFRPGWRRSIYFRAEKEGFDSVEDEALVRNGSGPSGSLSSICLDATGPSGKGGSSRLEAKCLGNDWPEQRGGFEYCKLEACISETIVPNEKGFHGWLEVKSPRSTDVPRCNDCVLLALLFGGCSFRFVAHKE